MGWALINFLGFQGGRFFKVGAYSKVGGYSNKYGVSINEWCCVYRPEIHIVKMYKRLN